MTLGSSLVRRSGWVLSHYVILLGLAAVMSIPLLYLLCSSLRQSDDMFLSWFLPPGDGFLHVGWNRLTGMHFIRLFRDLNIGRYLLNSVFLASVSAVLATTFAAMAGYALAVLRFTGRNVITHLTLLALVIPPALLIVPNYSLLYRLGLLDTYAGVILPSLVPAFGVYLFRQAIVATVPTEIIEAARIDGCTEGAILFRIILPIVRPTVSAFMLVTFVASWNSFITPQIVLQREAKFPLSVALAHLKNVYAQDYALQMAGTVVAVVPVLLLFIALQRDFLPGITSGVLKR